MVTGGEPSGDTEVMYGVLPDVAHDLRIETLAETAIR